ncbi:nuclear transport factor 2 family protein [Glycomyces albidus]|uniref:Nuclear transport factor 2 family protein n=1 Tax=Glycomyces albidus TaxID=2656774 RepID=A0A6L5G884_9ACTN|nr:nuclear transport factor 2 family protein [Glycomyces albidus]MQM25882.1 nuclear transport factor 2 family protein [Glycomyces albidus]
MTDIQLPAPIREFIEATNAGDTDRFLSVFTEDAFLSDWGREFNGIDGVGRWNQTDNIGMESRFEVVGVEAGDGPDEWIATLRVSGNGFNGTGPMKFRLRGDKIARLVIE